MNNLDHVNDPVHLLDIAIRDTRAFKDEAKSNSKLIFNVTTWHMAAREACSACVAGAVMRGELKAPDDLTYIPESYDHYTESLLRLLDEIRVHDYQYVEEFITDLNWDANWSNIFDIIFYGMPKKRRKMLEEGNLQAWKTLRNRLIKEADRRGLKYERATA